MRVADAEMTPDPSGALYWAAERMLIVADLHLEKGSAYAARGQLLPPYDTHTTLTRLEQACTRHKPAKIVALGDSFHDRKAEGRLDGDARARLKRLIDAVGSWTWILGNHDPEPPQDLGGAVSEEITLGPIVLRHEPKTRPSAGEIAGHLHPAARVAVRGRSIRKRCFVTDGERLVMPAFGAYTGGLDIWEPALRCLFAPSFHAWMLGDDKVHAVSSKRLGIPSYERPATVSLVKLGRG
jgi:DNA ligase-associated metallophosphoesterase